MPWDVASIDLEDQSAEFLREADRRAAIKQAPNLMNYFPKSEMLWQENTSCEAFEPLKDIKRIQIVQFRLRSRDVGTGCGG